MEDDLGHDWQVVTLEYPDGYVIKAKAAVRDTSGRLIGHVDTDVVDWAKTQLGALTKAYFMERKIKSGKLQPIPNL